MLMDGESLAHLWELLLPADSPVARAISWLILSLFLVGLCDAVMAIWSLVRERRRIDRAGRALLSAKGRPSELSAEAIVKFLGVPADSAVARRIARVLQLRTARVGGLQQTTSGHLDRYGLLARYIASILTLVGLLGTVLGLSFALFKIQGALAGVADVQKLQNLTEALGSTLRGMKTAFACTLAGLSTSLLLSLVNHLIRRFQTSLAERLDDFTFRGLLPFLERLDPGADQAAKAFSQVLWESAQELDRVRETVSSAASQYGSASQGLTDAVQALGGIVQSFESSVSKLSQNQQGFTQALAETRDTVRHLDTGIEAHGARLAALSEAHGLALRASSDLQVDLGLKLETLLEKQAASDSAESQRQLVETLQRFPDHFKPILAEYEGQLRAFLTRALEEMKTSSVALASRLEQEHRETIAGQLEGHGKAYDEALQRSIREMEKIAQRSDERLRPLFESQAAALQAFSDMVRDVHSNVSPLFDKDFAGNGRPAPAPVR